MKIKWNILVVACSVVALPNCNYFDGIPVIGLDSRGVAAQVFVPKSEYVKRMMAYTSSVQDSLLPVLNRHDPGSEWALRTVIFGAGVNAEVGIGPFRVGAFPRFRMIFSNSKDPSLP